MKKVYFAPHIKLKEIGWEEAILGGSNPPSNNPNDGWGHEDHLSKGSVFDDNFEDAESQQWGD